MNNEQIWSAIMRMASISHSMNSNIQRDIKRVMDSHAQLLGDMGGQIGEIEFQPLIEQRTGRLISFEG